jgi:hypothetical protein
MSNGEFDPVNHPPYYGGKDNPYEVIKVAEAWGLHRNAYLFNVLKYIGRPAKGRHLQDLKQAVFYLQQEIRVLESAAETEAILADPEATAAIAEERGLDLVTVTVRYVPAGDDDPWGTRVLTEAVDGSLTIGSLKDYVVHGLEFGNPGAFSLRMAGEEASLAEFVQVAEMVDAGTTGTVGLELVRAGDSVHVLSGPLTFSGGPVASPARTRL